jgi:hypothetical protein
MAYTLEDAQQKKKIFIIVFIVHTSGVIMNYCGSVRIEKLFYTYRSTIYIYIYEHTHT